MKNKINISFLITSIISLSIPKLSGLIIKLCSLSNCPAHTPNPKGRSPQHFSFSNWHIFKFSNPFPSSHYLISKLSNYLIVLFTFLSLAVNATSYTWNGATSSAWNTTTNWTPNGTPGSGDYVTITATGTNRPLLPGKVTINGMSITGGTFNLNGDTLILNSGTSSFSGGTISNGLLQMRGTTYTFSGATLSVKIDAVVSGIVLNGGMFNNYCYFETTSVVPGVGTGGCTFNDSTYFYHNFTGGGVWRLNNGTGNTFNGKVTLRNKSTSEISTGAAGINVFNGNVVLENSSSGGIYLGDDTLRSGNTISVGANGYTAGEFRAPNFYQAGTGDVITLTFTGTALPTLDGATFNGTTTINSNIFLFKNCVFNGTTALTATGSGSSSWSGGNRFYGNATIINNATAGNLKLDADTANTYYANATFNGSREIRVCYGADVSSFYGNITAASNTTFSAGSGTLRFYGSNNQTVSIANGFYKTKIEKSAGNVTLSIAHNSTNLFTFNKGNLVTTSTNLLTITSTGTVSGASDSSFVDGPVKKVGNSAFVFPVGKGTTYRAVEISAPASATDAFTGEYYNVNQTLGSSMDTTIDYISQTNYWKLSRNTGVSTPSVKLYWNQNSCGILDSADLRIAEWNGTKWKDKGANSFTGVFSSGKLSNNLSISNFNYFTFAYKTTSSPIAVVLTNDTIVGNDSIPLIGVSNSNSHWEPSSLVGCPNCPNTYAAVSTSTKFYFSSTDYKGRTSIDSIFVTYVAPLNLQLLISGPSNAEVCNSTTFSSGFNVLANQLPFTFSIVATANQSNGSPISIPNPLCAYGTTTSNPVQVIDMTLNTNPCLSFIGSPFFDPTTNTYTYTVGGVGCIPADFPIRVELNYSIILDCSLIPQSVPQNQPIFLNQMLTVFGQTEALQTNINYPHIVIQQTPITFAGNFGQTTDLLFTYKNNGFNDVDIRFGFADLFHDACSDQYDVLNTTFYTSAIPLPNTLTPNGVIYYNVTIPAQGFLYIKEHITIKDCESSCINTPKQVEFKWQCGHSLPLNNQFCTNCETIYKTTFVLQPEVPKFTVIRTAPAQSVVDYDNLTCLGSDQTWSATVTNISQYNILTNVEIKLKNPSGSNSLYVIYDNFTPGFTHSGSTTPFCPGAIPSYDTYSYIIPQLTPGQTFSFSFIIHKCCIPENVTKWEDMLGVNKAFNQWTLEATANTTCQGVISQTQTGVNDLDNGNINHGISTNSNTDLKDINLAVNFPYNGIDINAPSKPFGVNYCYGDETIQDMFFNGLTGDDFDLQTVGYTNAVGGIVKGILRARVHCDKGLVMRDIGDPIGKIEYNSAGTTVNIPMLAYYTTNIPKPANIYTWVDPLDDTHTIDYTMPDCENAEYDFYFELPTDPIEVGRLFNSGKFEFRMRACCTASEVQTNYNTTFSLLMNSNSTTTTCGSFSINPLGVPICNNCCWLPLTRSGYHMSVHCPGCRAPGMIVDDYKMERNTFGYEDAGDDRVADNFNIINPSTYLDPSGEPYKINKDAAVHGDEVIDRLVAHFEKGNSALVCTTATCLANPYNNFYTGYTYTGDMTNHGMSLNVLQLYKSITKGGCNKMNLKIESVDFYFDEPSQTAHPLPNAYCIECDGFKDNYKEDIETKFKMSLSATFLQQTLNNPMYENNSALDNLEEMFTFHKSDVTSPPTGVTVLPYGGYTLGNFKFLENQQYRIVVKYKVEGNSSTPYYTHNSTDLQVDADIFNWMWLNGGSESPLPAIATHQNWVQMPNLVYFDGIDATNKNNDMESVGLCFSATHPYCANCIVAVQSTLADNFKFYCEPRGNSFRFYSSDFNNITSCGNYSSDPDNCNKIIRSEIYSSYGMGDYINGSAGHKDIFPFEFRPPILLPTDFSFTSIPPGYSLVDATVQSVSFAGNYSHVSGFPNANVPSDFAVDPTYTPGDNSINFSISNIGPLNLIEGSFPSTPSTDLFVGDEYCRLITILTFEPNCTVTNQPPNSFEFKVTDEKITFGNTDIITSNPITTQPFDLSDPCLNGGNEKDGEYGHTYWTETYPNLNLTWQPPNITASTNEVCWKFTMTNILPTSNPGYTDAYNVFITEPITNPNLINWHLTYDYINYSTPAITPLTPSNGYFNLFPTPGVSPYPSLKLGVDPVIGNLCATYNNCYTPPATINFNWGWNCSDDFSGTPCFTNTTSVELTDNDLADIQVSSTTLPPNVTLCDNNNALSVCFKNLLPGNVKPKSLSFINAPFFDVQSVTITNSLTGNSWPISSPYNISVADLAHIDYPTGFMKRDDIICVDVTFRALCQFGTEMQLPKVILTADNYCLGQLTASIELNTVPIYDTKCTDCFKVEKTALVDPIVAGSELQQYSFIVSCFNQVGTYPLYLGDNYPNLGSSFLLSGLDPFNGGGSSNMISVPLTVSGTPPINTVTKQVFTNYVNGYLTVPGQNTSDQCNEAFLTTDVAGLNVVSTDDACVNVLPNCSTQYVNDPNTFIIPDGTLISNIIGNSAYLLRSQYVVAGKFIIDVSADIKFKTFLMSPGAEIIVNPKIVFTLTNNTMSACSQKMWKGITLLNNYPGNDGATFSVSECTISDAEKAVNIRDYCHVSVFRNNFTNNYISIYVSSPSIFLGASYINQVSLSINSNSFIGTGALAFPYVGQTTLLGNIPKAGIEINRLMFSMTNPGKGYNSFINLSNGVMSYRSNVKIENAYFENIHADHAYDNLTIGSFGINYNGSGIYVNGVKTNFMLDQTGFGISATDVNTFSNCDYGIFAERMAISSHKNKMLNVKTAYHIRIPQRFVNIYDNNIDATQDAIQLIQYDLAPDVNVRDNTIIFGSNTQPLFPYWGIKAEGSKIQTDLHRINHNFINFRPNANYAFGGIYTIFTQGLFVTNNFIEMDNVNINHNGIYMSDGDYQQVKCNHINMNSTVGGTFSSKTINYQSAITIEGGANALVGCNEMDYTNNGLLIVGNITGSSVDLKGNEFNNHGNAFRYTSTATSIAQYRKGNIWNVQTPLDNGLLALNENASWSSNEVGTGNLLMYPPLIMTDPQGWFVFSTNPLPSNYSCLGDPDACASPAFNGGVSEFDRLIATNQIQNDPYTNETRWMFKKELYSRIVKDSSLRADSIVNNFYLAQQGTTLAGLIPIENDSKDLLRSDSLSDSLLLQYKSIVEHNMDSIGLWNDLLDTAFTHFDTLSIRSIVADLVLLQKNIYETNSLAENLIYNKIADQLTNTAIIQASNGVLVGSNNPEDNQKILNEIYLRTIGQENYLFTQTDKDILYAIANMCPMVGGSSVFMARSLYSLVNANTYYDDYSICNTAGFEFRREKNEEKEKITNITATIYPNPTDLSATLAYNTPIASKVSFSIFSMTNQQLLKTNLLGGDLKYTFNTQKLKPAVYFYELKSNGIIVNKGKLVIIR